MRFAWMQHMRVPGSGCASPRDIQLAWSHIQAAALRDLLFSDNARPDGRGFKDTRPLSCHVRFYSILVPAPGPGNPPILGCQTAVSLIWAESQFGQSGTCVLSYFSEDGTFCGSTAGVMLAG
jgi:hypothetical protein